MFEMHLIIGITDGWQGCEPPPPAKLNEKPAPYLACILVFTQARRQGLAVGGAKKQEGSKIRRGAHF